MANNNEFRELPHGVRGFIHQLFDRFVPAITQIDSLHRGIHDGHVYDVTGKHLALADEGVLELLISVPVGTYPHMNRNNFTFGKGDVDVVVRSGVTQTDEGTELISHNVNEASSNRPVTKFYYGPTITVAGTVKHVLWAPPTGTGIGQSANGIGGITAGEEWVMAPGDYSITITNNSGSVIDLSYDMLFYELGYSAT
jgi:hypothetical protein